MKRSRLLLPLLATLVLSACKVDLVTGLSQRQANEAIALLQRNQIDAQKQLDGKKAFKVVVADDQFPDAVGLLAQYQLPSRDDVAIGDIFPADSLVTTPTSERARLLSGIEQRLEKTVSSIDSVDSARVHASYPVNGVDPRRPQAMRVAIVVNYDGVLPEDLFTEKIKRVARNSFDGLAYDNISVVLFQRRAESALPSTRDTGQRYAGWLVRAIGAIGVAAVGIGGTGWWYRRRRHMARTADRNDAGMPGERSAPSDVANPVRAGEPS